MTQKQFKHLFTPLEIGSTVLKNRLGFAPNCPVTSGKQAEGTFDEDSVSYYGERAKGGQGLIIIGNTRVSKSTTYYPYLDPQLFDDSNIQPLHKIATKVQSYGAKLFIQLFHTSIGRSMEFQQNALYKDPDVSTVFAAPTAYSSFGIPGVNVKEVDLGEIQQITQDYSQAAIRAALAKVDGVEIAASHSMLPWQFLSPYFNKRNDFDALELLPLLSLNEEEFRNKFKNSPIKRTKLEGLKRNVCVALGNLKDKRAVVALLGSVYDKSFVVRVHAVWALGCIGIDESTRMHLLEALDSEKNPEVVNEIQDVLNKSF